MQKLLTTLCFFLLLTGVGQAQLSQGGQPYSAAHPVDGDVPVYTTTAIDVSALLAEDEIDLRSNSPLRFAYGHAVSLNLNNSGSWTELNNGDRIWRLTIKCPDAININLLYDQFYLPRGASLYLYSKGYSQILGAFTQANNTVTGRFATALVHGETMTLEYYEPASQTGMGLIQIAQIGHGYRDLDGVRSEAKASGDCQVDVNCPEGDSWQDQKKGVARMVMDGLYLCTGSLINTTANDCKPYFLTANHCLMGGIKQDAVFNPDVSGYVFYWNYETASCNSNGAFPEQTTTGGTVLANAGLMETGMHTLLSSDFALLRLTESPRGVYDVYFNGWDATGAQGNTGVGIHHPAGDVKKISTHNVIPALDGYYWSLFWSPTANGHSVTEGGSSGSPLFRENGLITGQLFGGSSVNCSDPANDLGLYGRLDYSWTNDDELVLNGDPRRRLLDWLDPIGGGTIRSVQGAYNACQTPRVYFASTAATVAEEATSATEGCRSYTDYTYTLGITPYPTQPVDVSLFAGGTAAPGASRDYALLTTGVSFNNVTNSQTFTVRVYDDAYAESNETIELDFVATGTNGLTVGPLAGAETATLTITSADAIPNGHVQTVRTNSPTEVYLGPHGTVYYQSAAGGMMIAIENQTGHDYGCTTVGVEHAGGAANNNWTNGTTLSKTLSISPEFVTANGSVQVTVYIDDNELAGWEWFNNQGLDRDDLLLQTFAGIAVPANENTASAHAVTYSGYGSGDFVFAAQLDGLAHATNGVTLGVLGNAGLQGSLVTTHTATTGSLSLTPNLARHTTRVKWEATTAGPNQLHIVDADGRIVQQHTVMNEPGYNEMNLDVTGWAPGMYWVRLIETGQLARLVVQ